MRVRVLKKCLIYCICVNNFTKSSLFHLSVYLLIHGYLEYDFF